MKMDLWSLVALIILIVGGINWGFVGLFSTDLVTSIFGSLLARLIFIIVAVAAVYMIYILVMKRKELM